MLTVCPVWLALNDETHVWLRLYAGLFLLYNIKNGEVKMGLVELSLLAVGLSMDAFAVAICTGLTMKEATFKKSLVVGFYFGVFQAGMPLIGYLVGRLFADSIIAYDHWIAFALLGFIGGKMIMGSLKKPGCPDRVCPAEMCSDRACPAGNGRHNKEATLSPAQMLPLAVATSVDALAVGVSLAFLQVSIVPAVSFIGVTTLVLSMAGVKIGSVFGSRYKSKAEFIGGVILVLMGLKILLEHIGII
jgi:putative Mn2+ efflux pump MntP